MCLAIPMKVKTIEAEFAKVESAGILRKVNIQMINNLKAGDYILVHAGFAIEKLDPAKARETLRIINAIY